MLDKGHVSHSPISTLRAKSKGRGWKTSPPPPSILDRKSKWPPWDIKEKSNKSQKMKIKA